MQQDRLHASVLGVRHGRWSFEVRADEVAEICFDETPLLRAIRPVVRDHDWNTVPASVLVQRVESTSLRWEAEISLRFAGPGIEYSGDLAIEVAADLLTISFTGTAETSFRRNRIGLVVLHLASEAGNDVVRIASDGSTEQGRWPELISAHQPFRDVHGFRWQRDLVKAELHLDGDVFETEDQRNWTDASFKTYSTPLDLPFPVRVQPGDQLRQEVRLTAARSARPAAWAPYERPEPVVITSRVVGSVPGIATSAGGDDHRADLSEIGLNGLDSLVVELTGAADSWSERLERAAADAALISAALDVRIVTSAPEEVAVILEHHLVRSARRLAVFDPQTHVTTPALWAALKTAAESTGFAGSLLAGARSHFTELNRQFDQLPIDATGLTFSITPQMHAFEVPHIVDSLAGQRSVLESSRALAGERPLHIGPITLRQRFNAVATSADAPASPPDPLQATPFAAAWTLGSVSALTGPGVATLCYYQLAGPGGLIDDASRLLPVGELLTWLVTARGRPVLQADTPSGIVAYAVAGQDTDVLIANLTERPRTIRLYDQRSPETGTAPATRYAGPLSRALAPWSWHRFVT